MVLGCQGLLASFTPSSHVPTFVIGQLVDVFGLVAHSRVCLSIFCLACVPKAFALSTDGACLFIQDASLT